MYKYLAFWFVLLFIAVASGALRDLIYGNIYRNCEPTNFQL